MVNGKEKKEKSRDCEGRGEKKKKKKRIVSDKRKKLIGGGEKRID